MRMKKIYKDNLSVVLGKSLETQVIRIVTRIPRPRTVQIAPNLRARMRVKNAKKLWLMMILRHPKARKAYIMGKISLRKRIIIKIITTTNIRIILKRKRVLGNLSR